MMRIEGSPVTPAAAASWYASRPNATTRTSTTVAPQGALTEIDALAVGLGAGRLNAADYRRVAFQYVRNNIAVEFRYGLGKGGRGALIDQSGTPFDQAELLAMLLDRGGVGVEYQSGVIVLTATELRDWTGAADPASACRLLANGGIPVSASNCAGLGATASLELSHIWIKSGGLQFDPAMKKHARRTGMDIRAAMGCPGGCAATPEAEALVGAEPRNSPVPGGYRKFNASRVNDWLQARAGDVQTQIQTANPLASIKDVLADGSILIDDGADGAASLSYAQGPAPQSWSHIYDAYRTKVILDVGYSTPLSTTGIIHREFWADEASGQRLWLSGRSAHFLAEDRVVDTLGSCNAPCNPRAQIAIDHPYAGDGGAYGDKAVSSDRAWLRPGGFVQAEFPAALILSFGDATNATTRYQADLQRARPEPAAPPSPQDGHPIGPCSTACGVDLPTAAAEILFQQARLSDFSDAVGSVRTTRHHVVGFAEQRGVIKTSGNLTYEDTKDTLPFPVYSLQTVESLSPRDAGADRTAAAFEVSALLGAVAEALPTQQGADSWEQVSTPGILAAANKGQQTLYLLDASNVDAFTNEYQVNYLGYYGAFLKSLVSNGGYQVISPDKGYADYEIEEGPARYKSRFSGAYAYKADRVALLLNGRHKGAASNASTDPVEFALRTVKDHAEANKAALSLDVAEASGGLNVSTEPDLETGAGGFPYSLPFIRTYNSDARTRESLTYNGVKQNWTYEGPDSDVMLRLGGGWTHNFSIAARIVSSTEEGLGASRGVAASSALASIATLHDLMADPTFKRRMTAVLVVDWLTRQFMANAVVVTQGGNQELFARLPDRSYVPANASGNRLVQTGERKVVTDAYGYNYGDVTLTLTDSLGSTLTFDKAVQAHGDIWTRVLKPNKWKFPNGIEVNFFYTLFSGYGGDIKYYVLGEVSNNLGRLLHFDHEGSKLNDSSKVTPPDVGFRIKSVRDENNRTAFYTRENCPQFAWRSWYSGPGIPQFSFLACNTLKVTLPDTTVWTYDYAPPAGAPDLVPPIRATYRLRKVFGPLDLLNPLQRITYDALGRVTTLEDRSGRKVDYFTGSLFEEFHRRAEARDGLGATSVGYFGAFGEALKTTDANNLTTRYAYDDLHRLVRTTRPEGDIIEQEYDLRSNVTKVTHRANPLDNPQPAPIVTRTEYVEGGANCSLVKVCNRPFRVFDAKGQYTEYAWDGPTGNLISETAPADRLGERPTTTYSYETYSSGAVPFSLLRRKTIRVDAARTMTTAYVYNDQRKYALKEAVVDEGGLSLKTTFGFDLFGNLTSVDGPLADDTTDYIWLPNSRLLEQVIEPAHEAHENEVGQFVRSAVLYSRNAERVLTQVDKGLNNTGIREHFTPVRRVKFDHDAANRTIRESVLDGLGSPVAVTDTSYDAAGRPQCEAVRMTLQSLPALGGDACMGWGDRITETHYDPGGRVDWVLHGKGAPAPTPLTIRYAYSANGQRTEIRDGLGHFTAYAYDRFDRLVRINYPDPDRAGATPSPIDIETFEYDLNGNRLRAVRRDQRAISFVYDNLNRPIEKHLQGEETTDVFYEYDLLGRVTEARFGWRNGEGTVRQYDKAGRLEFDNTLGKKIDYAYDAAGRRTRITHPDAFAVAYDYDPAGYLRTIREVAPQAASLVTFTYTQMGERVRMTRGNPGKATYAYDGAGRLVSVSQEGDSGQPTSVQTMAYNAAGQARTVTQDNPNYVWGGRPPWVANLVHDGQNRIQTLVPDGYDDNGNQTLEANGARTFKFNLENQLVKSQPGPHQSQSGPQLELSYDPLGRLAKTRGGDGLLTRFLYDGDQLVAELSETGTTLRRYIHGDGVDEPLVWYQGAVRNWLHADRQGSIIASSDPGGVVQTYTFGPYGEPSAWNMRFAYTGQIALPEAQLYHYKARVYDPVGGRFLQTDPIGQEDGPNLYAYVKGDPINNSDPDGKQQYQQTQRSVAAISPTAPRTFGGIFYGQQVATWNQRGRDLSSTYRGHYFVGDATWRDAQIAETNFARFQAADANARGVTLAPNQPGSPYQFVARYGTNARSVLTSRSTFRKGTVTGAWEGAAPGPSGGRVCWNCGAEVLVAPYTGIRRDWDVGHGPSWTNRLFMPGTTRPDVINNYQTGVRLECIGCNRGSQNNDSRFINYR